MIGIVKTTKVKPYGKHTGKDIKDLAKYNQLKYTYCPFAIKQIHKEPNDEDSLLEFDDNILELYHILKNNFDKVVFVISEALGIRCSAKFWKNALEIFVINHFYCYPWLTEANLPYIFAYFGLQHTNLLGQSFLIDSPLYKVLNRRADIKFISDNVSSYDKYKRLSNNNKFLNLKFRFYNHKQYAVTGELLTESITLCVDDMTINLPSGKVIYEEIIKFDERFFINVLNKSTTQRQQWLLDIANEVMPELTK